MLGLVIIIIIVAIIALYLFMLCPNRGRQEQMRHYEENYIAHRGLFNNADIPENSIKAFQKAVSNGYGIELDVQMTSDGELVVFHDETLKRMCGVNKTLFKCEYGELMKYRLLDTDEKIPTFESVLKTVGGRVPLVIEIKPEGNWRKCTEKTVLMLDRYEGEFCIESFSPMVINWIKKNRPHIIRGQLSMNFFKSNVKLKAIEKFLMSNLLTNFWTKPDFIAYNHKHAGQLSYSLCRKLYGVENAAWTIKSQAQMDKASNVFQIMIFDSFIPKDRQ